MLKTIKIFHLYGIWRSVCCFFINYIFAGTNPIFSKAKLLLFRAMGHKVGDGTTIVGPVSLNGHIEIGNNCWINRGFSVRGNGVVRIGNNCDIAPDVTFLTGGHEVGSTIRRAGKGQMYKITIQDGVWIGGRSTILGNVTIAKGAVIAACSCVKDCVPTNVLVAGVPAKIKKQLI